MKKIFAAILCCSLSSVAFAQPEINVTGNTVTIADGDVTPSFSDWTEYISILECTGTVVRSYTIQNTGTTDLQISSVAITGPQATDFTITGFPAATIAAGGSSVMWVTCNPIGLGPRNATVVINSDDSDESVYDFAIRGTGLADVVNPTISCPANIVVNAATGLCSAVVTFATPTATDNCPTAITIVQTAGLPSGSAFPVGATVNTFRATDASGNFSTCSFTVTVNDAEAPVLYNTSTVATSNAAGGAYSDGWHMGDNDGTGFGSWNLVASTGNTAQAGFVVASSTTNGSGVDSNGDQDINSGGRALGMYANSSQATQATRPLSAPLSIGRTLRVELDNGNVDNGQITGFQLQNSAGNSLGEVRYRGSQAGYEIVDINGITPFTSIPFTDEGIIIEVTPTAVGISSIKLTRKVNGATQTLTSTLFPGGGNQTISRIMIFNSNAGSGVAKTLYVNNLTVVSATAGCPSNISVANNVGVCGATVVYNPIIAIDNCSTSLPVIQTAGLPSGSLFPVGTTINSFTATDGSGNTGTCSFTVVVADTSRPVITSCPGAQSVVVGAGCTALVPDYTTLVTATDNCGAPTFTQSPAAGSSISLGTTVSITVQAADASGNVRTCVFNLTAVGPEMNVTGNSNSILDGDVTPSTTDLTDYGSAIICGGQVTHTFVIENTGNDTLDIIGFSSPDMSYMVTAYSSPILPGNSGTISIVFQPVTAGLHTSTISISNSDCDESPYNFTLTGFGYEPDIDLFGNSVLIANNDTMPTLTDHTDFGTQTVCAGTVSRTFTIDNNSTPGTGVFGISASISGANASDFTVTANPATGISWAMQTTTFTVTFDPSAPGLRTATINITSNDCDENPYTFAISGLGVDPEINVRGNGLTIADEDITPSTADHTDFGSVLTCTGNIIRTFTVENTGTTTLNAGTVTITGANQSDFSLFTQSFAAIAPGGSGTFQIRFDPSANGIRTAIIHIGNDDCNESPYDFTVQGIGNADLVSPAANCQNLTVYLNGSGSANVIPAMLNNGSSDNCGIASMSVSQSTFSCANVGTNNVTLTVTDAAGNSSTCTSVVTVLDSVRPVVNTQNITVQLNAAGTVNIIPAMVNNGSSDACGIASMSVSPNSFTCANRGANTVTLTVTDVNGNSRSGNAVVTVMDTIRPVANCQNINAYLNASGTVNAFFPLFVSNTFSDNCGSVSISFSALNFNCSNIGANNITVTGTDDSGNMSSCISVVTVLDTIRPVANTQNLTLHLNAAGTANLTAAMVNNGSTDACGIASMSVSPNSFSCANVGANTVTLTVTDVNGNSGTGNAIVTVVDTVRPTAICRDTTLYLSSSGTLVISPSALNLGSSDACGIASMSVSPNTFNCSQVATNAPVTLTVTDVNGNSATCVSLVDVYENLAPVAICQNTSVYLDGNGSATITAAMINNGSYDECSIAMYLLQPFSAPSGNFSCSNVGPNTITLQVFDTFGNMGSCSSTVTVLDTVRPIALAQNITVTLSGGTATVTATSINNGSSDACGIASMTVSPNTFTCSNLGPNTVTLTVTDVNGNSSTATAVVTVLSDLTSNATLNNNVSCFGGNNGQATISTTGGAGPFTYSWSPSGGTGSIATGLSAGTYTATVTDGGGCTTSSTVTITQPGSAVTASSVAGTILCNGGSTTVTVTGAGGIAPYTGVGTFTLTAGAYAYPISDANGCPATTTFTITEPSVLSASSSATSIGCNGGTATVTVIGAGGTSPYTGEGTFTVNAGTYTYTVTDVNGCTATTSITVTEPTILSASSSATSIACNGGTATVTVIGAGGTSPYTGEGTFTVNAGTYSYTVTDANGCTATASITLTEPTAISTSVVSVNVLCFGDSTGSIDLTVSGGTGSYTFDWNNGAFATEDLVNIPAGTYNGVLTDANGCTDSGTIIITEPNALSATITSQSGPTTCGGADGAIDNTVNGGTVPYSFLWNNSAVTEDLTGVIAGAYSCDITDANGCTTQTSAVLNDPNAPTVTLGLALDTMCIDDATLVLTGESPSGGTFSGPGVAAGSFNPSVAGVGVHVITYSYTDISGCSGSAVDSIYVDLCLNVTSAAAGNDPVIYPNPNSGTFTIQTSQQAVEVQITDATGKLIEIRKVGSMTQEQFTIDVAGVYWITSVGQDGSRSTQRVVVTR